jgi:L-alanine-DL-glutamate epimerase-like enolase superfamily enzyme
MRVSRRGLLTGGAAALASSCGRSPARAAGQNGPSVDELDRAAGQPVVDFSAVGSPVVIDSVRLLKKDSEYFVHVRSKDGAEGVSLSNGRAPLAAQILNERIAPYFVDKDVRDLENHLWELYRWSSNYKLQGLLFWSAQAWVEFAILDMFGRILDKPMGELLGGVVRKKIPYYVASGRRDSTPEEEVEYLQSLVEETGARAVKFRLGGRMSRNADAMPGRTPNLIALARKTLGDSIDIHGDANSSYDPPQAIEVGRMLEEVKAVYFEEPCPFDHLEDTKKVTDTLDIPVSGGEQEFSERRFRWMIANRGVDIVQPDLHYYGGMIRSLRVAHMADVAGMSTTVHISGGFGFVYMLHFASVVRAPGRYQEYKRGIKKYGPWFDPPLETHDGAFLTPRGPGVGIQDVGAVLEGAEVIG